MRRDFSTHETLAETPGYALYRDGTNHALGPRTGIPGGAAIVVDSLDRVLLVEQHRHPLDMLLLEIPRGFGDVGIDATGLDTALREATEETGLNFDEARIADLGIIHPDSGILALDIAICAIFLPTPFDGLIAVQEDEIDDWKIVERKDLGQMIGRSEITDAITIAAYVKLERALAEGLPPVSIDVKDCQGNVITSLTTHRPIWSFNEYCRNRETPGWSWSFSPG